MKGWRMRWKNGQELLDDILAYNAACGAYDPIKEKQMKKCHACGQKLPLKVGEMVEFNTVFGFSRIQRGIVTKTYGENASILGLDGCGYERGQKALTRLHGYYRITEREPLA